MYIEREIEERLRIRLSAYGFKVLKLQTPGHTGVMDRMILRPRYAPGPPIFVELKRPKKTLRPLQKAMEIDWKARGCTVLPHCSTMEDMEKLCDRLIAEVKADFAFAPKEAVYDTVPNN